MGFLCRYNVYNLQLISNRYAKKAAVAVAVICEKVEATVSRCLTV